MLHSKTSGKKKEKTRDTRISNFCNPQRKRGSNITQVKAAPRIYQRDIHLSFENQPEVKTVTSYKSIGTGIFIRMNGNYNTIMKH